MCLCLVKGVGMGTGNGRLWKRFQLSRGSRFRLQHTRQSSGLQIRPSSRSRPSALWVEACSFSWSESGVASASPPCACSILQHACITHDELRSSSSRARAQPASVSCEKEQLWAEMATVLPMQADGETGASCVNVTRVSVMEVVRHRAA